jgi:hypothetical protein
LIGVSVNRAGGINGLLLLITAICGVSGLAASIYVINALNASSKLSDPRFYVMLAVIAAAFIISMILYVLYYRMEEMKAFYAAMLPLITEAVSMTVLVLLMVIKQ